MVLKYVNRSDCSSNTRFVEYREKTLKTQHTLHQNRLEYVSINIKMMFRQTHNPMKSGVTATVAPSHRVLARDLLTITFLHWFLLFAEGWYKIRSRRLCSSGMSSPPRRAIHCKNKSNMIMSCGWICRYLKLKHVESKFCLIGDARCLDVDVWYDP